MSFNINGRATVFAPEDKGNYYQANLSTGSKQTDGSYKNMSWRARFVGNSKVKASQLQDKDQIIITEGLVENTYDSEKQKTYVNVIVFDFNMKGETKPQEKPRPENVNPFKDAPKVVKIDDDILPF